ncbi:MAG: hypothetical protein SNJ78_06280, partial [Spirochaetales bacterium]
VDYPALEQTIIPEKATKYRILCFHGIVPGVVFQGIQEEEEEESVGVLDPALFTKYQIDYAALGHIHKSLEMKVGQTPVIYPGSARVWREGEEGPRNVYIVHFSQNLSYTPKMVQKAGSFIRQAIDVSLEGNFEKPVLSSNVSIYDWVQLEPNGVVEDENRVVQALEKIQKTLQSQCRRVTVNTKNLHKVEGLVDHPLAQQFLKAWQARFDKSEEEGKSILRYARAVGLQTLQELLGSKK